MNYEIDGKKCKYLHISQFVRMEIVTKVCRNVLLIVGTVNAFLKMNK